MSWERWLYAWRARLRVLLDSDRADRELDDELQHHLAREIEVRRANGLPAAEARRQALAALGGLTPTREQVRASRFGASLEAGFRDVRHGLRLLRRHPGFTAATVLTLTLSIGATTAIFSVVDAVLLQPPLLLRPGAARDALADRSGRREPSRAGRSRGFPGLARSGPEFRTRDGDRALVAGFHRRRRAGDTHRIARHGRLLRDAGRQRCPRSHVPAGGVPAGQAASSS